MLLDDGVIRVVKAQVPTRPAVIDRRYSARVRCRTERHVVLATTGVAFELEKPIVQDPGRKRNHRRQNEGAAARLLSNAAGPLGFFSI
jgi:hypothetical protein